MDTFGTVVVYIVGGTSYTVEDLSHQTFMLLKSKMEEGKAILFSGKKHIAINSNHVTSIEWIPS